MLVLDLCRLRCDWYKAGISSSKVMSLSSSFIVSNLLTFWFNSIQVRVLLVDFVLLSRTEMYYTGWAFVVGLKKLNFSILINNFNVKRRYLLDGPQSRNSQGMEGSQLLTGLCLGPWRQRPRQNWVRRCEKLRHAGKHAVTRSRLRFLRIHTKKSPGRHRRNHKNRIRYYVPAHLALRCRARPRQLRVPRVQMLYLSLLGRGGHPSLEDWEPVGQY